MTQEIRAIEVTLAPPYARSLTPCGEIWVVQANEIEPPADEEPIKWTLITSLEACIAEQARAVLDLYLCRWQIEVYHRVLKTGCRVEELQLRDPAHPVSHPTLHDRGVAGALCHAPGSRMSGSTLQCGLRRGRVAIQLGDLQRR